MKKNIEILAGDGCVVALDALTGDVMWKQSIVTGLVKRGTPYVAIKRREDTLLVHTYGHVASLELSTGKILWKKKIKEVSGIAAWASESQADSPAGMVEYENETKYSGGDVSIG